MLEELDLRQFSGFFSDTAFDRLMQRRIYKVLLICSAYDAFLLEEDGRIEEQIFNEYVSLNLRYPPQIIHVKTANKAFKVLKDDNIDLVITMLSVGGMDPFLMAKKVKKKHDQIPIVVLTPFSREVSLRLSREDTSAIDYIFCWLGNADILLAIIKLIEDVMNVEHDIAEVGVQCILLVEDSVRFYSSYLPLIYRIVFTQSKKFMDEGLNEHQKMMRMRGRPKILLANNYEEAMELYLKYKDNLLGIISDISYDREGEKDSMAGIKLAKYVKGENPYMPFLLQSSNIELQNFVTNELRVGFLYKHSKVLLQELKSFLRKYLGFGDFIFINPKTRLEVERVSDLKSFQEKLFNIPDDSLLYHFKRDHVSKWLNARALFSIAEVIKQLKVEDFNSLEDTKIFIFETIANFRFNKGRGIIAKFYREKYDKYLTFSRVGDGSIGGKARGLAFLNMLIKKHSVSANKFDTLLTIPTTVVLCTDVFDDFMEENDLYSIGLSDRSDEDILDEFVHADLPERIAGDLIKFISVVNKPIAIRSSSVLEDSHYQPFAGIYSTYMIALDEDTEVTLKQLCDAIKCVYASVFYKSSKAYMSATMSVIDEEHMGIVLQEVVGQKHEGVFYPTFSGVARSVNFYPIEPEKAEDGILNVALGLGKQIVEGEVSLRFSPLYPKKVLQLSTPDMAVKETQKYFYALDLNANSFVPSVNDGINLKRVGLREAEKYGSLKWVGSVYDLQNNIIRDGLMHKGIRLVTFSNILKYDAFPLAQIIDRILKVGQSEMNQPVEVEFAVDLETPTGKPGIFYLLQIRPIVDSEETINEDLDKIEPENTLIYSKSALGNGIINDVYDVVFIKQDDFNPANNRDIVNMLEEINIKLNDEGRQYVLIGPGRWGSQDPWLGIPVKWTQISGARVIVETVLENYHIDPSQGTHFFQNITSLRVGYFHVNSFNSDDNLNVGFLNSQPAVYENEYIKHVRFNNPCVIKIDGKNSIGVVMMPEEPS